MVLRWWTLICARHRPCIKTTIVVITSEMPFLQRTRSYLLKSAEVIDSPTSSMWRYKGRCWRLGHVSTQFDTWANVTAIYGRWRLPPSYCSYGCDLPLENMFAPTWYSSTNTLQYITALLNQELILKPKWFLRLDLCCFTALL